MRPLCKQRNKHRRKKCQLTQKMKDGIPTNLRTQKTALTHTLVLHTLRYTDRTMPHIHEQIDFTVACFIVYQGKVLLAHHRQLHTWLPVGGHIELDEDPEQALFREIQEECGLEVILPSNRLTEEPDDHIKYLIAPEYLDIHHISPTHRHIGMVYFARAKTDQAILAPAEHHALRWFAADELADPQYKILNNVRRYGQAALARLG